MTNYEYLLKRITNKKGDISKSHSPPKSDISVRKKYTPIRQSDFDEKLPTESGT
jgi:hypothetical protein